MFNTFTHIAQIITITFVTGADVPSTQTISIPVQNESFCESVIQDTKTAIKEVSPGTTFITWCPKVSNPINQSEPRVGPTTGPGVDSFNPRR